MPDNNIDMKSKFEFFQSEEFMPLFNFCFHPTNDTYFYSGHGWRIFTSADEDNEYYEAMSTLCDIIEQYKKSKGNKRIANIHYLQEAESLYRVQRSHINDKTEITIALHFPEEREAKPEMSMQDLKDFSLSELNNLQNSSNQGRH